MDANTMYLSAVLGIVVIGVGFMLSQAEETKQPLPGKLPSRGESIMQDTDLGGIMDNDGEVPGEVARDFTR
jgi:hypothetical protein